MNPESDCGRKILHIKYIYVFPVHNNVSGLHMFPFALVRLKWDCLFDVKNIFETIRSPIASLLFVW